MTQHDKTTGFSRREVLSTTQIAATAMIAATVFPLAAPDGAIAQGRQKPSQAGPVKLTVHVNGASHDLLSDPRATLLDVVRERLELTGSKKGCDHGQCGACTMLVDGRRVLGCLTLAISVQSEQITTIEGLSKADGTLHPMQQAFIDHDGFQCGYCTPGQIMSAIGCVAEGHAGSDRDIREYMSGNLCRCAAYPNIVAAIKSAKPEMEKA